MATMKSQYQGKPLTDRRGRPTEPAYYIVNPKGIVHICEIGHARMRLRKLGYRLATDDEIERFQECRVQSPDKPIATPYSPEPLIEPDMPDAEDIPEKLQATQFAWDLVAEHKLNMADIQGTGAGGQVLKKDVEAYMAEKGIEIPEPDEAPKRKAKK